MNLTGNASIGGAVRFDIGRNTATVDTLSLNGNTLTKLGGNQISIVATTINGPGSIVNNSSGDLSLETSTVTAGSGSLVYDTGNWAGFYENVTSNNNTVGITWPITMMGNNVMGNEGATVATIISPINLLGNLTIETLNGGTPTSTSNDPITLLGNITDNGAGESVTMFQATTTTLFGTNSWSGATNLQLGTMVLGSNGALPATTTVNFGVTAGTNTVVLDLGGFSPTVAGLAVLGGTSNTITNNGVGTATLTFAGGGTPSTFSGAITNGVGVLALTVSSGSLTLNGTNDSYTGDTNVTGGTLTIGDGTNGSLTASGQNVIVGSGGTFAISNNASINSTSNLTNNGIVNLNNSGQQIATLNGTASTASLNLNNSNSLTVTGGGSYAGAITGASNTSFNVNGNTLTLTGASTLAGTVNINSGRLVVNGTLASTSPVSVSGGILSGIGSVGNVNLSNGTIDPGTAVYTTGELTVNNITATNGSSTLNFDLGTSGAHDELVINGTATFNTNAVLQVSPIPGDAVENGTYVLVSSATALSNNSSNLPTMQLPASTRQTFSIIDPANTPSDTNLIEVVVGGPPPGNLFWTGADSNNWDVTTQNWLNSGTLAPDTFFNFDSVTLDDAHNTSHIYNINLVNPSGSQLEPSSVTVNTTGAYTLSGSGSLGGGGSVTIIGGGTLVLANSGNNYSGATNIQNGLLQLQAGNSLSPNSPITLGDSSNDSGQLDLNGQNATVGSLATQGTGTNVIGSSSGGSTLTVAGVGSTTFAGTIRDGMPSGGSGQLSLNVQSGTLILSGVNSYSGSTNINSNNNVPTATLQIGAGSTTGSISSSTSVADNGVLVFDRSDSPTFSNPISGNGAVQQIGAGTTTLSGNLSYGGTTTITSGTLAMTGANTDNLAGAVNGSGSLIVGDGTNATSVNLTVVNGIKGSITINNGSTLNLPLNSTVANTIGVTLNGGTEVFANTTSTGNFGANTVTVGPGASLLKYGANDLLNAFSNQLNIASNGSLVIDMADSNGTTKDTYVDNDAITGGGPLTIMNSGSDAVDTYTLSGPSPTFTGGLSIGAGNEGSIIRLEVNNATALGTGPVTIYPGTNNELWFNTGTVSYPNNLFIQGVGTTTDVPSYGAVPPEQRRDDDGHHHADRQRHGFRRHRWNQHRADARSNHRRRRGEYAHADVRHLHAGQHHRQCRQLRADQRRQCCDHTSAIQHGHRPDCYCHRRQRQLDQPGRTSIQRRAFGNEWSEFVLCQFVHQQHPGRNDQRFRPQFRVHHLDAHHRRRQRANLRRHSGQRNWKTGADQSWQRQ